MRDARIPHIVVPTFTETTRALPWLKSLWVVVGGKGTMASPAVFPCGALPAVEFVRP